MDDTLAGGSQVARKEKVCKGKLKRNNSSTVTTHIYMSRTENSEMMDHEKWGDKKGMNTSSIVDRGEYTMYHNLYQQVTNDYFVHNEYVRMISK